MTVDVRIVPLSSAAQAQAAAGDLSPLDDATLVAEKPQETWLAEENGRSITARCSLWWHDTPMWSGRRAGYIGHFAATNREAAVSLLDHAARRLAAQGCGIAIAPIDGSTWRRYRLVTGGDQRPSFLMEPRNPPEWVDYATAAGFTPIATYCSAISDDLGYHDPRLSRVTARLCAQGVTLRCFDPSRVDEDLRRIHALSLESFRKNLLYTPLAEEDFRAVYRRILPLVRPEHVLLAERGVELVGFLFGVPDHAQAARGEATDTLIMKTLAVKPHRHLAGLGRLLCSEVKQAAVRDGYRKVIYALMHDSNPSYAYVQRFTRVFRRYALYAKRLP